MPNIAIPLTGISQSVSRPVIFGIIAQVQALTGIDPSTKIFFPGDIGKMSNQTSSIDSQNEREATFNTDRYNFIEVDEDYDNQSLGETAISRREHIPIFEDGDLGVWLAPIYATSNVTINFKYRAASKTEVLRWRDDMRMRLSQMRDVVLHDITYHYQLPTAVLMVFREVYDKREATLPYGQTFVDYVTSYATDRLTIVSDLVGGDQRLAITEKQTRIQGLFATEAMPEKAERDDTTGTWSISFGYKFNYEKPTGCHMRYPVMVHNSLLDASFIDFTDKAPDINKVNKSYSASMYALNSFEMGTIMNKARAPDPIIRIPTYDDFIMKDVLVYTGTVISALTEVDPIDKRSLLNLNELGDICMDEDILTFMRESEWPYMTKEYCSILSLSLYRNSYLASSKTISCDSSLNVKATEDLNLRNQHRIRIALVTDISMLRGKAIDRLLKYPKALVKIIGAMNELLRNHPDFIKLGDKQVISKLMFSHVYSFLTGYRLPSTGTNYHGPGINTGNLFDDIDPRVVENYRRNALANRHVMINSIVAIHQSR